MPAAVQPHVKRQKHVGTRAASGYDSPHPGLAALNAP